MICYCVARELKGAIRPRNTIRYSCARWYYLTLSCPFAERTRLMSCSWLSLELQVITSSAGLAAAMIYEGLQAICQYSFIFGSGCFWNRLWGSLGGASVSCFFAVSDGYVVLVKMHATTSHGWPDGRKTNGLPSPLLKRTWGRHLLCTNQS